MSGHKSYKNFSRLFQKNVKVCNVPIIYATPKTLSGYATTFEIGDYSKTKVINKTWIKDVKNGRYRDIHCGTGNQAKPSFGMFEFYYRNNLCFANNQSVPNGNYIIGATRAEEVYTPKYKTLNGENYSTGVMRGEYVYTFEANYHPCGGQVICPINEGDDFIALLSKAGDSATPNDFIGFYCNGKFGIQILPYVWHQPVYPLNFEKKTTFMNKQSSVHACVVMDTLEEYNTIMKIPLVKM